MRISRWVLIGILIIAVLAGVEVSILMGWINPGDLVGSFFLLVYAIVVISVLAIIGAVFVGIYLSHRILATRGFTPFEQEMFLMREEVQKLSERVDAIAANLGVGNATRPKRP